METDRMLADVADATARREGGVARSLGAAVVQPRVKARREDGVARSPVAVVHLRRARKAPSRMRRRRTRKIRRNPVNPRRVAVTAEVVAALRQLAEAASEAETARVLVAVVVAVPTDRGAAFDPGVRVVTVTALARCAAAARAGDGARRRTVEAANDAAETGAPIVGEVGAEAAVLRG